MCLILLAWHAHPRFPLVVAANRDEFHARASASAEFWGDRPRVLAGRDLEAGGTWLGISREGRFAAVTNYRGGRDARALESRGMLVTRFLAEAVSAPAYAADVARRAGAYSGYNLLACDGEELWWHSNRSDEPAGAPRRLAPGIYGLGNLLLDSPEVEDHRARFARTIDPAPSIEPLFATLAAAKIVAPQYGTRCSTVICADAQRRVQFAERAYDAEGAQAETLRYEFTAA